MNTLQPKLQSVNQVLDKLYAMAPDPLGDFEREEQWHRCLEDEIAKADRGASAMFRRDDNVIWLSKKTGLKTPTYELLNNGSAASVEPSKQNDCSIMAQKYAADFNWFVFPANLEDGAKKSHKSAEHSNGANWGMTKDAAQIRRDFKKWPLAGIGVPTGAVNNLVDIETDTMEGHGVDGDAALQALETELGPLPTTREGESPSASVHRLFKHPGPGFHVKSVDALRGHKGVDVKGDGGMFIAPPSRRPDGEYCWINDLPIAELPEKWREALTKPAVSSPGKAGSNGAGLVGGEKDGFDRLEEEQLEAPILKLKAAMTALGLFDAATWLDLIDEDARKQRVYYGHILKNATVGQGKETEGLELFLEMVSVSLGERYSERHAIKKWRGFKLSRSDGEPRAGAGTLFMHANEVAPDWWEHYQGALREEAAEEAEVKGAEAPEQPAVAAKGAEGVETEAPVKEITLEDLKRQQEQQTPAKALFDPWAQFIVPTFPLEILPPTLLTYVIAQAEVIGVDVSSMAMTVLAACSSALSHCFQLKMMRHGNWYASPRLWVLLFGDSSKKKTPTILAATKPLKDYQDLKWAEYEMEKNFASIQGNDPPPPPVRYVVYDSTIEKLADLLSRSDRGILLKRDELAGWLGGMEKYGGSSHGANSDRGHYLELYDGGGRVVDRVKRGEAFIKNFSASFIGGIQPKKLVELRGLTSDGLLQRFLPNVMIETTFRKDEPCDEKAYDALLQQLLEAVPDVLTLSNEALEVMETLHRYLYDLEKHAGGLPEGFDAFVGKLAGVAGNFTLVLHMVSDPKSGAKKPVKAATVKDVQKLIMEFILPHALEFYECAEGATTGSHRMRKLASWILTQGKERFVSSDLTSNIADFRGLKEWDLNQYVSPLVAAGWITPTDKGPLHKSWKVSPNVFTQFTERAKQEEASKQALAKLMNSPRKEKI